MRQTYVGPSQLEGSVRPLPHSENTRSQELVEESVERGSRVGGKGRIASVFPRLIQELVLLSQMALQQDDAVTACSLLEASAAGAGVLPEERLMDARKGHDTEVITSGLAEVGRGVAAPGRAMMPALTSRKLRLVAQGLTDAQVAEQLVISPRTVNWHLSVIYSKLGVSSRTAATRFALEHKLI